MQPVEAAPVVVRKSIRSFVVPPVCADALFTLFPYAN
jgi:hypothetical protein